jgi:ubiquinone/menaquinone biosynthesis C-methylase UbiE
MPACCAWVATASSTAAYPGNLFYVQADAQYLPFPDDHFDCITIAFGLRNVTDKDLALRSMLRVLKPGGRLLVLEFSKPRNPLLRKPTTPTPSPCCRSWVASWPATATAISTSPSPSACTRTRKRCAT